MRKCTIVTLFAFAALSSSVTSLAAAGECGTTVVNKTNLATLHVNLDPKTRHFEAVIRPNSQAYIPDACNRLEVRAVYPDLTAYDIAYAKFVLASPLNGREKVTYPDHFKKATNPSYCDCGDKMQAGDICGPCNMPKKQ